MNPSERLERAFEREEELLSEQLAQGEISREEYNKAMQELQREAREYARDEQDD